MNELQTFTNSEFGQIRSVTVDGQPWFVGKDVASALGYTNPRKAVRDHIEDDDKGEEQIVTPSGTQTMSVINESGLYSLILSSKLESAKRFKRWVTKEVLPEIREQGRYVVPSGRSEDASIRIATIDDYIKAAQIVATCKNERLPYVLAFLSEAGISTPPLKRHDIGLPYEAVRLMIQTKEDKHLNNAELGKIIGLDRVQTHRYLSGACKPSPSRAEHIITCLKENNE